MAKNDNISTLPSVIKQGVLNALKELHTHIPGIIESFDKEKQTASVQPAIKRVFKTTDGVIETLEPIDLPKLINVPVIFSRGGGFSMTFPVKQGNECLIEFCERSIDIWHKDGGIQEPGAKRFHSLSDAVCHVGLSSLVNKIPNFKDNGVEIKNDEDKVSIFLDEDGNCTINTTKDLIVVTEGNVTATVTGNMTADVTGNIILKSPSITLDGNVTITQDLTVSGATSLSSTVTSNGKDISDTHTHDGSPTAPSGPKTPTGTPL